MTLAADSRLALLTLAAENMFRVPSNLTPAADPILAEEGWVLRGYLTGVDALFRKRQTISLFDATRVFYGFLAESVVTPGTFVVVVRGTEGFIEWLIDGEFGFDAHPVAGRVEAGFWGLYETMKYADLNGVERDLVPGLVAAVGPAGLLTAVGHSLGAALATYLTFDVAYMLGPARMSARLFASPRPGDTTFASAFARRMSDCVSYAYALDVVPMVPAGLGYCPLDAFLVKLSGANAAARIKITPLCNHHALCYATMLDYNAFDVAAHLGEDFRDCVLGQFKP